MTIGKVIRERRRELGLLQAEIADLSGVSERFVREVEADKPTVRLDKLTTLVEALGLELVVRERQ
ncbi:helix-turn-helix transcriptional regulator [Yimella sp. cx-573]|nr:helix-turn-helix transcriptional regulator [Yimella sp. cx-573]